MDKWVRFNCEPEYEVRAIIGQKLGVHNGVPHMMFQVIWKGWEDHPDGRQWLHEKDLSGCTNLLTYWFTWTCGTHRVG